MIDILTQHEINNSTLDELCDRLEQLSNTEVLTARFNALLEAALRDDVIIKIAPAQAVEMRVRREVELRSKIAETLMSEFEKVKTFVRVLEGRERFEAMKQNWHLMPGRDSESFTPTLDEFRAKLERLQRGELMIADMSKATAMPSPVVSADAPVKSVKPTEAEKLASDRRRYGATGEVTTRLLCDIYSIERGALGQRLRKMHNLKDANGVRFISDPDPRKFSPGDREKVKDDLEAGAVKKRPKRPDK